jgi:hypothetical protein
MSIVFEVTLDDQPVQLEITRDGELIFLDYNITHDLAALEFGYPDTDATKFYAKWQERPVGAICYNLGLDKDTLRSLAADWAEHVLPFFELEYPEDKRPRLAIEAARDFVAGKIDRDALDDAGMAARGATSRWPAQMAEEAELAAGAAFWVTAKLASESASEAASESAWAAEAAWAAQEAAWAAGAAWAAEAAARAETNRKAVETAWQVRRFVDCMEAIGQGFDWPDMKVTP